MKYRIATTATMKPCNKDKWWIDENIVRTVEIDAESLSDAMDEWVKVCESCGVDVSKTALKKKSAMYRDEDAGNGHIMSRQVGYVITASTDFRDDNRGYVKQYIDLWVEIKAVTYINLWEA